MNTCQIDKRLARTGQIFIVFGEPPVLREPGERPLHNPTLGQHLEAYHTRWASAEVHEEATPSRQTPTRQIVQPCQPCSYISSICEYGQQPRQVVECPLKEISGTIPILDSSRMHYYLEQQPKCIYEDVPL